MNSVHDLGGMHGFGASIREENEPPFHHDWELRMWALLTTVRRQGMFNIDEFRRTIEHMNPIEYLTKPYFEKWLLSTENMLIEKGFISQAEIEAKIAELAKE